MRSSTTPLLHLSRYGWFVLIAAAFGAKDMCAGGGHPPDPPPADASPGDASKDGAMSQHNAPTHDLLALRD